MGQLQLSTELIDRLLEQLAQHDPQARDQGVAAQYLAAVTGFLLGRMDLPAGERRELLEELSAFSAHVMDDVQRRASAAPAQEAYGVWRPGDP